MLVQRGPSLHRGGRLHHQAREVHGVGGVQDLQVAPVEPRQLDPAGEARGVRTLGGVLRPEQGLLGPEHELADLVGEPAQAKHGAVGGPGGAILALQQLLDLGEVVRGREDGGGRRVAQRLVPPRHDVVGELTEDDDHAPRGQGCVGLGRRAPDGDEDPSAPLRHSHRA